MKKVLSGIRIVEQGTFITGPCAAMLLADLGADVIKVESPGTGDPYRNFKGGLYSAHFQAYNRGKRSIALDLKTEADRGVFQDLVRSADVYIQNFRPGTVGRLGIGPEDLQTLNSKLVYCSISGFGQTGPYVARPSYDTVTQALSGFLSVATDPANPRILGPALADALTGVYASIGILGALVARGMSGKGSHVEISMLEAMMHFSTEPFYGFYGLGDVPNSLDRPRLAQAFIVRCLDDKMIALHLSSLDKFWDALVTAIDGHDIATDERFCVRLKRIENYPALLTALNGIFASHPREEWLQRLSRVDVPYAPVNDVEEVTNDPQVDHLGVIVPVANAIEGARHAVRSPFTFDGARDAKVGAAPLLNQHGDAIRAELETKQHAWPALVEAA